MSKIIIHVDFMQNKKKQLEELSELWGEYSMCSICGEKLKDGDLVDGHFPHMSNYNRCEKHKNIPMDDDREFEYLRGEKCL